MAIQRKAQIQMKITNNSAKPFYFIQDSHIYLISNSMIFNDKIKHVLLDFPALFSDTFVMFYFRPGVSIFYPRAT